MGKPEHRGHQNYSDSAFFQFSPKSERQPSTDYSSSNERLLPSLVCTALTEPGQLPLGRHRAARLVWGSPGLPATFRAKPHGMSDGTQTPIMVLAADFFFSFFFPILLLLFQVLCFGDVSKTVITFFGESASK